MGLFEKLFGHIPKPRGKDGGVFRMLNGYTPAFTSWRGSIYESELVRASIGAIANHISKLSVDTHGAAKPALQNKLKHAPNGWQTWSQFLYRTATILYVHNTAFIVPVFDMYGEVSGIYTVLPDRCEIVDYDGTPYLRYKFTSGKSAAIELKFCGILNRFQYSHDLFGESNAALLPTMDLVKIQNRGIEEGVKNSASYRFMAKMNNFSNETDLALERKRFSQENLSEDSGGGGLLLFPNKYSDIKQLEAKPFVIDAQQMQAIKSNVFNYFGVNEDILQNRAYGDAWNAFYEGAIEPFAVQFSEIITKMLFTLREQSQGNFVMATSNRLQYMSNADKLNVSAQLLDRGIMSINDVREIWNLPPVEDGDKRIIRGEYYDANVKLQKEEENDNG